MSYYNQREHHILDRKIIRDLLMGFTQAMTKTAPSQNSRAEHLAELMRLCGSELERDWLRFLEKHNLRLPSRAQALFTECQTRPDFVYDEQQMAVYIDGPLHQHPDRAHRDVSQVLCLEDMGWTALRFTEQAQWPVVLKRYRGVFGDIADSTAR